MKTTTEHTPTPWTQFMTGKQYHVGICQAKTIKEVALVLNQKEYSEADANAAFIVRAVNAHEALLDALNLALATIERLKPPTPYDSTQGTRDVIKKSIKQAEGE